MRPEAPLILAAAETVGISAPWSAVTKKLVLVRAIRAAHGQRPSHKSLEPVLAACPKYCKVLRLMLQAKACCQLGAGGKVAKNEKFEASRSVLEHVQLDAGSSKFGLQHGGVAT